MKAHIPILIAGIILLGSCEKLKTATTDFPTSITLQGINISGAEGLAIMNIPKESAQTKASTKADDEPLTRLVIVSKDGTKIAEFYMKIEGATNNPLWQKIYPTLTYVPEHIIDFSTNFILLANVHADYDYDLSTSEGFQTKQSLDKAINTATGSYLLRKSNGKLYNCPFAWFSYVWEYYGKEPFYDFNETSDKKTISYGGEIVLDNGSGYNSFHGLMLIKDTGDNTESLESINTNGQVIGNGEYWFSYLPDDDRCVVFQKTDKTGSWSFDMNLSPTYLDFGDNLKSLYGLTKGSFFVKNGKSPYFFSHTDKNCVVGKIICTGKTIDCVNVAEFSEYFEALYSRTVDGDSLILNFDGKIVKIDTETDKATLTPYPEDFPKYMSYYTNGVYHELSSDFKTISRYDLNTMQKTTVSVKWGSYDDLVSGTNFGGVGFFTVTGLSRKAETLSYLINKETGEVTLLGSQTYTAPAVTSYQPLN